MSDAVAAIIYGSQQLSGPRGLRPALDADAGGAVLGGAELNFAEAMAAFIASSQPDFDSPDSYEVRGDSTGNILLEDVEDAPIAPAVEGGPGKKRRGAPAKKRTLPGDAGDSDGEDGDSDGDGEDGRPLLASLAEPRAEDEGGLNEAGELAAEGMLISDMVDDEEMDDALDGLTSADFGEVDSSVITVGTNMYFQATE